MDASLRVLWDLALGSCLGTRRPIGPTFVQRRYRHFKQGPEPEGPSY